MLEAGAKMPTLKIADDTGTMISTKDLLGKHLVLFFYPKADTPGCTNEASQFRGVWPRVSVENHAVDVLAALG